MHLRQKMVEKHLKWVFMFFLQRVQVRYTNGYCDIVIGCIAYPGMTPVFPAGVMMSRQTLDPMVCTRGYARLTEDQLGGGVMWRMPAALFPPKTLDLVRASTHGRKHESVQFLHWDNNTELTYYHYFTRAASPHTPLNTLFPLWNVLEGQYGYNQACIKSIDFRGDSRSTLSRATIKHAVNRNH
jgi:hypothetical protein